MNWPNSDSSSSPTGFSSETGACADRLIESTSSGSMPVTSAISSGVGSRPSSVTSLRSARPILFIEGGCKVVGAFACVLCVQERQLRKRERHVAITLRSNEGLVKPRERRFRRMVIFFEQVISAQDYSGNSARLADGKRIGCQFMVHSLR